MEVRQQLVQFRDGFWMPDFLARLGALDRHGRAKGGHRHCGQSGKNSPPRARQG
jgi:hypothetical protein